MSIDLICLLSHHNWAGYRIPTFIPSFLRRFISGTNNVRDFLILGGKSSESERPKGWLKWCRFPHTVILSTGSANDVTIGRGALLSFLKPTRFVSKIRQGVATLTWSFMCNCNVSSHVVVSSTSWTPKNIRLFFLSFAFIWISLVVVIFSLFTDSSNWMSTLCTLSVCLSMHSA